MARPLLPCHWFGSPATRTYQRRSVSQAEGAHWLGGSPLAGDGAMARRGRGTFWKFPWLPARVRPGPHGGATPALPGAAEEAAAAGPVQQPSSRAGPGPAGPRSPVSPVGCPWRAGGSPSRTRSPSELRCLGAESPRPRSGVTRVTSALGRSGGRPTGRGRQGRWRSLVPRWVGDSPGCACCPWAPAPVSRAHAWSVCLRPKAHLKAKKTTTQI